MKGWSIDERILFRILLGVLPVFPQRFQRSYREGMEQTLLDRLEQARLRNGRPAFWSCFVRELGGLLAAGLQERLHHSGETRTASLEERISMKSVHLDIRQAMRRLRTTPAFSFTVAATLGLAIGAAATLYTLVDSVLLRPLPYPDSRELVEMRHSAPGIQAVDLDQTVGTFLHYSRHAASFQSMALYTARPVNLLGDGEPERVEALLTSSNFFNVLGVPPLMGRWFGEDDGRPGAPPVALLSHSLWSSSFGADPAILGRLIQIDGESVEVVGILPGGFAFPDPATRLWIPLRLDPDSEPFGGFSQRAVGRLQKDIRAGEAEAELNQWIARLPEVYPDGLSSRQLEEIGLRAELHPLKEYRVRSIQSMLWILLGSVFLVLTIAFLNVGNLFLVRAETRQPEVAVRQALGAGRVDIIRAFLFETGLLALAGGTTGWLLTLGGIGLLRSQGPRNLPRLEEVAVRSGTLWLCLGLALAAAIFLALIPSLQRRLVDLAGALKEARRGSAVGMRSRGKKILVAVQVALALVLLVSAALSSRSLLALRQVDPGFDPRERLTFRLSLPAARYSGAVPAAQFHRRLLEELAAVPGVTSVGVSRCLPLSGWCGGDPLVPEGVVEQQISGPVAVKGVNPDYFEALGIRTLGGRSLTWADLDQATGAAVISRTLAETYWPGQDPLGKRFRMGGSEEGSQGTVVGIVEDIRLTGLRSDPGKVAYFPLVNKPGLRDLPIHDMTYVVRTAGDPMKFLPSIKSRVRELDAELPMSDVLTLGRHLQNATADAAFATLLLVVSAVAANLLGALGLYAAMSYLVARRTSEIGVRMALGARVSDVGWMILREAGTVVLAGMTAGVTLSLAATRLLSAMLFGIRPTDPLSYLTVVGLVLAIGLIAALLPARRAAALEPARALHWN